jgi:hypothetical protein
VRRGALDRAMVGGVPSPVANRTAVQRVTCRVGWFDARPPHPTHHALDWRGQNVGVNAGRSSRRDENAGQPAPSPSPWALDPAQEMGTCTGTGSMSARSDQVRRYRVDARVVGPSTGPSPKSRRSQSRAGPGGRSGALWLCKRADSQCWSTVSAGARAVPDRSDAFPFDRECARRIAETAKAKARHRSAHTPGCTSATATYVQIVCDRAVVAGD